MDWNGEYAWPSPFLTVDRPIIRQVRIYSNNWSFFPEHSFQLFTSKHRKLHNRFGRLRVVVFGMMYGCVLGIIKSFSVNYFMYITVSIEMQTHSR